ncbi:MAG: FAD-dependent oxidoreductase [Caldilineaceae bacterium]|nr:FAD-dependent oxidoreductase [Caldilineaceae bacterium]
MAVIGGGNSAAEESLLLTKFADHVTILVRGEVFKASKVIQESALNDPKIDVRFNTEVLEFRGAQAKLNALLTRNSRTGREEEVAVDGAFVFIGLDPNTAFLRDTGVRLNQWGFIVTGHDFVHDGDRPAGYEQREPAALETSMSGIFAAVHASCLTLANTFSASSNATPLPPCARYASSVATTTGPPLLLSAMLASQRTCSSSSAKAATSSPMANALRSLLSASSRLMRCMRGPCGGAGMKTAWLPADAGVNGAACCGRAAGALPNRSG